MITTDTINPDTPERNGGIGAIVAFVALVAVAVNALAFSATNLWASPDASYYVMLAGGIADHGDFANEMFLIRPPGYPLMLAGIFRLFGSDSPTAIHLLQHAMVALIAIITTLTAWHLSHHRGLSFLAGLMTACSLSLIAYANVIMPEVPYALTLSLSVYFLVKYHRHGGGRALGLASLLAGLSYLFRPTGMSLVAICVVAAIHRAWSRNSSGDGGPNELIANARKTFVGLRAHIPSGTTPVVSIGARIRRTATGLTLAVVPALLIAGPAMLQNRIAHGADMASRCAGLALYHRAFAMDNLDAPNSAALIEIRATVAEARVKGFLRADDDIRQWGAVRKAYAGVKGMTLAESAGVMGEAAKDAMRAHPADTIKNTIRYAYWMALVPDTFYRFVPGGAEGRIKPNGECVRAENAELFDTATYLPMLGEWLDPYDHYLPLSTAPHPTTPVWERIVRWFHRNVATGPRVPGLGDNPYEAFGFLCLLGIVTSLFVRPRMTWLLVSGVVGLQVAVSAFLAGPTPRYAVPLAPFLLLYAALLIVTVARIARVAWSGLSPRRQARAQECHTPQVGSPLS